MSMRKVGPSSFVWDRSYQTDEELLDILWDESIDFTLALQAVCSAGSINQAQRIAREALKKHGKKEDLG